MTGWLPEGVTQWAGRPVARTVAEVASRHRAAVSGTIRSVRCRHAGEPWVEAELEDATGVLVLWWAGRKEVPGITCGAKVAVEGTALDRRGRLGLLNPLYRFRSPPP